MGCSLISKKRVSWLRIMEFEMYCYVFALHLGPSKLHLIDPVKYKSISSGFSVLLKEQGARGFFRGWVPTLLGYSAQGACKFGFYKFFKKTYSDMVGPENAVKYMTL
ncbi:hypothetical protein VPH35_130609 [Triticum aestivum]